MKDEVWNTKNYPCYRKKGEVFSIVLSTALLYENQPNREKDGKMRRRWFITGKNSKSGEPDTRLKM